MPAASHSGRSAACSKTLRSRDIADLEATIRRRDVLSPKQKKQAVEHMEIAECDINQPCGPHEWETLQRVLAPEYKLKIFQFKKGVHRLTLAPIYKG